jgi:uncharacterized protein
LAGLPKQGRPGKLRKIRPDGDEETGPNRTCITSRSVLPIGDLIRFVVGPDESLTPDLKNKLPGRGVWVTATKIAVAEAVRKKSFARSLKRPVTVAPDIADKIEQLLAADARQFLALANKAGLVISGFAKAEAAIAKGQVVALVCASDGSLDGKRKLLQAVTRRYGRHDELPVVSPFISSEMDLALGRENAIHAAMLAGPASEAFVKRCHRLEIYRRNTSITLGPDADNTPASTG